MKRTIFCLCSALLLFTRLATGQEESKIHFLLNGGLSLPQNPDVFKDAWSNGFNVGGGVGFSLSRHLTLQGLVNYDRFPLDEQGVLDLISGGTVDDEETIFFFDPLFGSNSLSIDVQGAEISILSISAELKASFVGDSNKVSPYVIGGSGIARLSGGRDIRVFFVDFTELIAETIPRESEIKGMATVGGGIDIPFGGVGVFVEGRYQFNFTEDERIDFVSLRGGVRIGL